MPKFIDLTGQRFGRLVVQRRLPDIRRGVPCWECVCDCGNKTKSRSDSFKKNKNASCGCYNNELSIARLTTHGRSFTPEYQTWRSMLARCNSPSSAAYRKYGAVGISVCDRWKKFENFFSDMGERPSLRHSIDRIDGKKNYDPGNCRWATPRQQQTNLKNNVRISHDGKHLTIGEWSDIVGLNPKTIYSRLKLGWSVQDALTLPLNSYHKWRRS